MPRLLAIDIGGTLLKSAIFHTEAGLPVRISEVDRQPTAIGSPDGAELLNQLVELVSEARRLDTVDAIGVVTPGLLDEEAGVINYATNLRVRDFALRTRLESATGLPVGFGHDGRASALAEHVLGAGQGFNDFVLMPIGTGISVGLVIDGMVRNAGGHIGEIGHANVGHSLPCACGLIGCLEVVASTAGISNRYFEKSGERVDAAAVIERAAAGEEVAGEVWRQATEAIALACDWLLNTLAPEAIIFAGGLSKAGDALVQPVAQRLGMRVSFQRHPRVLTAQLGDDAGALGAALLAMGRLDS